MPPFAILGYDASTNDSLPLGDMERCAGTYVLGRSGTGKTTLLVNLMAHDIRQGHGLFFLDPHGDGIRDLLARADWGERRDDLWLLDPTDEGHSFSLNVLACTDTESAKERAAVFNRARTVFMRLFENDLQSQPWLKLIIANILWVFIENQDYTIAEMPRFLTDRRFREQLLENTRHNGPAVEFWRRQFRYEQADSTLTRLQPLLADPYVRHIVGQRGTTVNFQWVLERRQIILVRLPTALAPDSKNFIGTLLLSSLTHAVLAREKIPPPERHQFCIFIDEFQNFASFDDCSALLTQGRKFGVAPHFAHQERFGQLAQNQRILGATDAALNKIYFQLAPQDAHSQAIEVAKEPPMETRFERQLVLSETPVAHLLEGHENPQINTFVRTYLRGLTERLEDTKAKIETHRLLRQISADTAQEGRLQSAYYQRHGLSPSMPRALQSALSAQETALRESLTLLELQEASGALRLSVRALDKFLVCLMEGKTGPGQEAFAAFLLTLIGTLRPLPEEVLPVLALYIALVCGDSSLPRAVPWQLAESFDLFSLERKAIRDEAEAQAKRQREEAIAKRRQQAQAIIAKREEEYNKKREQEANQVVSILGSFPKAATFAPLTACPDSLIASFLPYLIYPKVRSLFAPFEEARFDRSWRSLLPEDTIGTLFDYTIACRSENRQVRERLAADRDASALNALAGSFGTFLGALASSRLTEAIAWQQSPSYYATRHSLRRTPRFTDNVLHEFDGFLIRHGEGALVILSLLFTASRLALLPKFLEPCWIERSAFRQFFSERDALEQYYPHFHTRYFPSVLDTEPIEIFELFDNLAAALANRTFATDFAHLYWRADEIDTPGSVYEKARLEQEPRYGFLAYNDYSSVSSILEERPEVSLLQSLIRTKGLPTVFKSEWRSLSPARKNYLLAHVCDKVRFGRVVADLTFPLPPERFLDKTSFLVTDLMMCLRQKIREPEEREKREIQEGCAQDIARWYPGPPEPLLPAALPTRCFSGQETRDVRDACERALSRLSPGLETIVSDFVAFCKTLSHPDNHVRRPGSQYKEIRVPARPFLDMRAEMEQTLTRLPPHTAIAKVALEQSGTRQIRISKITTPAPGPARQSSSDVERLAREKTRRRFSAARAAIELDIASRKAPLAPGRTHPPQAKPPSGKPSPKRPPPPGFA